MIYEAAVPGCPSALLSVLPSRQLVLDGLAHPGTAPPSSAGDTMSDRRTAAWAAKAQNQNDRRLRQRAAEEVREALQGYTHTPSPESLRRTAAFSRCMRMDGLHERVD